MTPQFGMFGKLTTAPEDRDTLIGLLTEGSDSMQDMAGCHSYIISKDANDSGAVWVFELWDSKESHDASLTMPAVREIISRAMPILKGAPEGFTVIPVGGKGL